MVYDGAKAVTAAGARVPLAASSTPCAWLQLQADPANTGAIYVGGPTVSSTRGPSLPPGASLPILPMALANDHDLSDVYIDAEVSGDGVLFMYGVRV